MMNGEKMSASLRWSRRSWFTPEELTRLPTIIRDELLAEEGLASTTDITRWIREPLPLLYEGNDVHWEAVAQVVNPEVKWNAKALWTALDHLLGLDPRGPLPPHVLGDRPNPEQPRRRGLAYWYAALVHRGWTFPLDSTRETLLAAAQALVEAPAVSLARMLADLERNGTYATLRLQQLGGTTTTTATTKSSITLLDGPLTAAAARLRAAREYKANLADDPEPLVTYARLALREVSVEEYPSLTLQYDHRLPPEAYSPALLSSLADLERVSIKDLPKAVQRPSFLAGWWSSEQRTPVDWTPRTMKGTLSYGIPGQAVTLTIEEWLQTFREAGDVVHPLTRAPLSVGVAAKLGRLVVLCPDLGVLHRQAELLLGLRGGREKEVLKVLTADLEATRAELAHYQNLGMAMRGWVEGEPYPHNDIKGGPQSLVLTGRLLLRTIPADQPAVGRLLDLPLYLWRKETGYTPVAGTPDGTTIGARLAKIQAGAACIRVASNSLLGAVARYGTLIGWRPGFDIMTLAQVA